MNDPNPTVPVSAELLYQLSRAAGVVQFGALRRVTWPATQSDRERMADIYDELSDRACAVLAEHVPAWLDRRAEQQISDDINAQEAP